MKVSYKTGFCVHCGNPTTYTVLTKDEFPTQPTLTSYNDFIVTVVDKCSHCNFVSENITFETNPIIFNIVKSEKYNALLTQDYDKDIKYFQPSPQSMGLNFYDAYAYLCKHIGNTDAYIKTLFKCASLKDILIQKYTEIMFTSFCDIEQFQLVIENLKNSKHNDLACIIELSQNTDNEYIKCIRFESLVMLENFAQARILLHNLNISNDLKQHFTQLINSYEVDL